MAPISDCKAVTNIQGEVQFFTPLPSDFFLWVTGLSEETQGLCYRISSSSETQMLATCLKLCRSPVCEIGTETASQKLTGRVQDPGSDASEDTGIFLRDQ